MIRRAPRFCSVCGDEIAFGSGGICEDCRDDFDGLGDLEAKLDVAMGEATAAALAADPFLCDGCGRTLTDRDLEEFQAECEMADAYGRAQIPACCTDCAEGAAERANRQGAVDEFTT